MSRFIPFNDKNRTIFKVLYFLKLFQVFKIFFSFNKVVKNIFKIIRPSI